MDGPETAAEKTEPLKHPGLALAIIFPGMILLIFTLTNIFATGYFEHVTYRSDRLTGTVVKLEEPSSKCGSTRSTRFVPAVVRAGGQDNYYCAPLYKLEPGDEVRLYFTQAGRAYDFSPIEPSLFFAAWVGLFMLVWKGGDRLMAKANKAAAEGEV